MKATLMLSTFALLLTANAPGQGIILWNESVNGPFSADFANPTTLMPFQVGTNSIIGATEIEPTGPSWAAHPDFFIFQVPNGLIVTAVYLEINKPNVWTCIGEPSFVNGQGFSFGPSSGELLFQLGLNSIGANIYGMYMENHDLQTFTSVANYRLDFYVQPVPEPRALSLLLLGPALVGLRCWRTYKSFRGAR